MGKHVDLSQLENGLNSVIDKVKAASYAKTSDLAAKADKSDTYTKEQVDDLIEEGGGGSGSSEPKNANIHITRTASGEISQMTSTDVDTGDVMTTSLTNGGNTITTVKRDSSDNIKYTKTTVINGDDITIRTVMP